VLNKAVHLCPGGNLCSDKKREVLDLEEKELVEEDEVDKLLLQNICGDIMKEVMDVVGDDFVIPIKHTTCKRSGKKGVR
jgi:hypothetical protein